MKGWVDVPLSESEFGKFIRILEARDKDYRKALGSIPGLQEDATIRWEGGYGSTFERNLQRLGAIVKGPTTLPVSKGGGGWN